jgi:transglutaminase-like putative cysteine protease
MKGYNEVDRYIQETNMLDYSNTHIQKLIQNRGWLELSDFDRIKAIYNYVRDEILFGYNIDDSIPASKVLADGYGQCNTKGTLFMALLRACNIPCRVHGFTIDKKLQKGAMTGLVYRSAPKNVLHSWVEVFFEDIWYELEAFILDNEYFSKLQQIHSDCVGAFCGYGVAVSCH